MDLQEYFAALREALIDGGMPEAQSSAYCKRLCASLEALDEKAREEKLAGYGSSDELAARVLAIAGKQKNEPTPVKEPESNQPAPKTAVLEHTINVDAGKKKVAAAPKSVTVFHSAEEFPAKKEKKTAASAKASPIPQSQPEDAVKKPVSKRGMQIFWWTAGLSSPLTLFLTAILAGLFLFCYAALIVLAVAMIVAVTVTVIGGILLALICLAYGVVKMLPGTDAFFIGLYEFGLGMIAVGGTIVFSILEYNCATVLVPYTMKKLTVFLKFTVRQIVRLVKHLYGLCRDL